MSDPIKGLLKIVLGVTVGGIILYKAPVLELLTMFFYVVFIPMALLSSIGLVGAGTVDLMGGTWNQFNKELRDRVQSHREKEKSPTPPAVPSEAVTS